MRARKQCLSRGDRAAAARRVGVEARAGGGTANPTRPLPDGRNVGPSRGHRPRPAVRAGPASDPRARGFFCIERETRLAEPLAPYCKVATTRRLAPAGTAKPVGRTAGPRARVAPVVSTKPAAARVRAGAGDRQSDTPAKTKATPAAAAANQLVECDMF